MKRFITLAMVVILAFTGLTACFAEMPLDYKHMTLNTLQYDSSGNIKAITLNDDSRGLTITFKYYDVKSTVKQYKDALYKYDYTNDLLLITDKNGNVIYDCLEL